MQVRNVLYTARSKYRMFAHHHTTLLGYIFATKACIENWRKLVRQQYLPDTFLQYGELRPISRWDLLASLGHPRKFQQVSHLRSVTARHSSSGRHPNLYSARQSPRRALAHIL